MNDILPLVSPREYEARLDAATQRPEPLVNHMYPATLRANAELELARAGTRNGDTPAIQELRRVAAKAATTRNRTRRTA